MLLCLRPEITRGSDSLNRWPAPSDLIRTFGRPWVYFPFTWFNWVGCGSDPNLIRPNPWTALKLYIRLHLRTLHPKPSHFSPVLLLLLYLKECYCMWQSTWILLRWNKLKRPKHPSLKSIKKKKSSFSSKKNTKKNLDKHSWYMTQLNLKVFHN